VSLVGLFGRSSGEHANPFLAFWEKSITPWRATCYCHMTDKCHGLPITLKHDVVALGIERVRGHCLIMLLDTWIAGSGWQARNAHDHHCNDVPGTENPPSIEQYEMMGSLGNVS
jgi:hypothetical protein